jgi:hypothetical protein
VQDLDAPACSRYPAVFTYFMPQSTIAEAVEAGIKQNQVVPPFEDDAARSAEMRSERYPWMIEDSASQEYRLFGEVREQRDCARKMDEVGSAFSHGQRSRILGVP